MDSSYRPQSPDLSGYAPQSPDLSGYQPQSPDLSGAFPPAQPSAHHHHHSHSQDRFGGAFAEPAYPYGGTAPTSMPGGFPQYGQPQQQQHQPQLHMGRSRQIKTEPGHFKTEDGGDDDDWLPDAPAKRARRSHQSLPSLDANGFPFVKTEHSQLTAPLQGMSTQRSDPTLGVQLKTSFPVARIKRIMQADEDVGKVAQVTPHVVSRALELFMIKLIAASAEQARGGPVQGAGGGGGKGSRKVLAQHMKKAIRADVTFDFLAEIVDKVPDAPSKAKKEAGSDSEEGGSGVGKGGKKKSKKRKSSGEDF